MKGKGVINLTRIQRRNISSVPTSDIRVIIFDAGGVITNGVPSSLFKKIANENTLLNEIEREELISLKYRPNIAKAWIQFKTNPKFTEEDYWKIVREESKHLQHLTASNLQDLSRESMNCYNDVLEIIKKLSNLSYPSSKIILETQKLLDDENRLLTGVLSNHSNNWFNHFASIGKFDQVFPNKNLIFVSQQLECAKPDLSIFEKAHNGINKVRRTEVEHVLFVDDKLENVEAAKKFGWNAIEFNRTKHHTSLDLLRVLSTFQISPN